MGALQRRQLINVAAIILLKAAEGCNALSWVVDEESNDFSLEAMQKGLLMIMPEDLYMPTKQ